MPLNKDASARYKIIDSILNNRRIKHPTMFDFQRVLQEQLDKEISVSTIQKDIKAMKEDTALAYFAPIKFSRSTKSYYYSAPFSINNVPLNTDEKEALLSAIDLLHSFTGLRMTQDYNNATVKILNTFNEQISSDNYGYIITERTPPQNGIEFFDLIHQSIKERIPISFVHYNYQKRKFSSIILHPAYLKEFQGFWYVIGFSEQHEEVRTFGLDRIYAPYQLKKKYIPLDRLKWNQYFKNMIGVLPVKDDMQTAKIQFSVFPQYSDYILSHPIHHSQEVLEKEDDGYILCEVELIPTLELINYFLSRLSLMKVIEPKPFVKLIADRIYNSIDVRKISKK
jgi:predicted DNA-binding transcriptional regulator YafY